MFHSKFNRLAIVCLALLLLFVSGAAAVAQGLARITGIVMDPSGAAVPQATVIATRTDTG